MRKVYEAAGRLFYRDTRLVADELRVTCTDKVEAAAKYQTATEEQSEANTKDIEMAEDLKSEKASTKT